MRKTLLLTLFLVACGDDSTTHMSDSGDASSQMDAAELDTSETDVALDSPLSDTPPGDTSDTDARDTTDFTESCETFEVLTGNTSTGWVDGLGEEARFSGPAGGVITSDGTTIYISDTFNATLRRVDVATGQVETVAGRPQVQATADGQGLDARFTSPRGMAITPDDSALYLADGPTLRRVDLDTLDVLTIAGVAGMPGYEDGVGEDVRLGFLLHDLEFSADGQTLYIADRSNRVLRSLDIPTSVVSTLAGAAYEGFETQHADGIGADARFSGVGGIARIDNTLYVADTFNQVVRLVDLVTAEVSTVLGVVGEAAVEDGDASEARLNTPQSMVFHDGFLFTTSFDGLLRRISLPELSVETLVGRFGETYSRDGDAASARLGIAFAPPIADPTGDVLWYQDRDASSIRRVDLTELSVVTLAGSRDPSFHRDGVLNEARFAAPAAIAADATGDTFYVIDQSDHVLRRVEAGGQVTTLAGEPGEAGSADGVGSDARFAGPSSIAYDASSDRIYIADQANHAIRMFDIATGAVTTLAGHLGHSGLADGDFDDAHFTAPSSIVFDATTATLFVFEVDAYASFGDETHVALRQLDLDSSTVATLIRGTSDAPVDGSFDDAVLSAPEGMALDGEGLLYFAEPSESVVRVVDLGAGEVRTLAGVAGESGPADGSFTDARFASPNGIALAPGGRILFVTDGGNHTIRRLDLETSTVTTWFGNPSLSGGFAVGTSLPCAEGTAYYPSAPVVWGDAITFLSDAAVYVTTFAP